MSINDDERKDRQDDEKLMSNLKHTHKKHNKVKFIMTLSHMLLSIITSKIGIIVIIVLTISSLIGGLIDLIDSDGHNSVSYVGASNFIKNENNVFIATAENGQGKYFKITKKIMNEYLKSVNKAFHDGYFSDIHPDLSDVKDDFVYIDEENAEIKKEDIASWFKTEDFEKYLVKMIRAEIASSYPKIGEYGENTIENITDGDGDYVAQGIAEIKRTKVDTNGAEAGVVELKYISLNEFEALLTAEDNKKEVLDYFTFDMKTGTVYYATSKEVVTIEDGTETNREITIQKQSTSYKTIAGMCSMPYQFLFTLLQESGNPKWVMEVINLLLKESEAVLMIHDELNAVTETTVETSYHSKKEGTDVTFPYGDPITKTTITETYTYTSKVYIEKAHTWCVDFEQSAKLNYNEVLGEPVETIIEHDEEYFSSDDVSYWDTSTGTDTEEDNNDTNKETEGNGNISNENNNDTQNNNDESDKDLEDSDNKVYVSQSPILYSTTYKQDLKSYSYEPYTTQEKEINHGKFLGLWRNNTGKYGNGELYDENGKDVCYDLPDDPKAKLYPPKDISMHNSQSIDMLLGYLESYEETQMHEQLMKYYWNIWQNKAKYDVDMDKLLDFFDTNTMTNIQNSSSPSKLLKEYIHALEGAPMNADKTKYVIYNDSKGHLTVGYGVDIFNGGYVQDFVNAGIKIEVGTEVDIEFVDGIEEKEMMEKSKQVRAKVSGLGLTEYQIHALISRSYNCGVNGAIGTRNGMTFEEAYKVYWNEETDNLYDEVNKTPNFNNTLYTNYMSEPTTSKRRIYGGA